MERELRVTIIVEEIGRGTRDLIGERYIQIGERFLRDIQPLPDDREIMELMNDKSLYARMKYEENMKKAEKRSKAIDDLGGAITGVVKQIIESRDKVNGYEQPKITDQDEVKRIT